MQYSMRPGSSVQRMARGPWCVISSLMNSSLVQPTAPIPAVCATALHSPHVIQAYPPGSPTRARIALGVRLVWKFRRSSSSITIPTIASTALEGRCVFRTRLKVPLGIDQRPHRRALVFRPGRRVPVSVSAIPVPFELRDIPPDVFSRSTFKTSLKIIGKEYRWAFQQCTQEPDFRGIELGVSRS